MAPTKASNSPAASTAASSQLDDSKGGDKLLPLTRIRTIMKSTADQNVMQIKEETLFTVARATELFIQSVAKGSLKLCPKKNKLLEYKQLADFIQADEKYEFLHQILPVKITVKEFRKIMAKQKTKEDNSDEDDDDEDDEEDGSSSHSGTSESGEEEGGEEEEEDSAVGDEENATTNVINVDSSSEEEKKTKPQKGGKKK